MKALVVFTGVLLAASGLPARSDAATIPPTAAVAVPAGMKVEFQMPWDQPPPEFKEMERQGFHAGVQAAANDYDHHRSPEPERRKEFRHPHVSRSFQEDFRKGFVRGYNDAYKHLMRTNGRHS